MGYIICLSCLGHVGVRRIHSTCWGLRVVAAVMRSFGQCINVFKCGSSEIQAGLDCILRNVFVLLDVAKGVFLKCTQCGALLEKGDCAIVVVSWIFQA